MSFVTIHQYGVRFSSGLEVLSLYGDAKAGHSYLVRGSTGHEIEVRITPKGRMRVSPPRQRTNISVGEKAL